MTSYSLTHLADRTLLQELAVSVSQDRTTTSRMLAQIAEVDLRRLYVPAGYDSMYLYCVRKLHMSEDVAYKRICAARAARRFPAIFTALADGRLHLSAVVMLAPHLSPQTAEELLAAATHQTKAELELLLAQRFPSPDVPTSVQAIAPAVAADEPAVGRVEAPALQLAPGRVVPSVEPNTPVHMEPLPLRTKLIPLSPGKFAVQFTMDDEMNDDLLAVRALLGHVLPSGDVKELFRRALRELRKGLEKQKFAKCDRPRPQHGTAKGRHIPAAVKRAVWNRDGGQCTFVSEQGKRCESRTRLELDHIEPVARGGESTPDNLRLRCRGHNQYEAERTFSAEFMRGKREAAREMAAQRRTAKAEAEALAKAKAEAQARAYAEAKAREEAARQQDVIPWLRELKFSLADARKGAAACAHIPDAPLEQRMKVALRALAPHCLRIPAPSVTSPA